MNLEAGGGGHKVRYGLIFRSQFDANADLSVSALSESFSAWSSLRDRLLLASQKRERNVFFIFGSSFSLTSFDIHSHVGLSQSRFRHWGYMVPEGDGSRSEMIHGAALDAVRSVFQHCSIPTWSSIDVATALSEAPLAQAVRFLELRDLCRFGRIDVMHRAVRALELAYLDHFSLQAELTQKLMEDCELGCK